MTLYASQVDLSSLPHQSTVDRAKSILDGLSRGENHNTYRGKRMHYDRCVISIPVGYRYRLLLLAERGSYVVIDVMSHERYNNIKTIQKRVKQVKRNWSH